MKKLSLYVLGALLLLFALGIALQFSLPGCKCDLQSGCHGCGGMFLNSLCHYSNSLFALGAILFVLLIWFGIPIAIIGLVLFGIYKLFSATPKSLEDKDSK